MAGNDARGRFEELVGRIPPGGSLDGLAGEAEALGRGLARAGQAPDDLLALQARITATAGTSAGSGAAASRLLVRAIGGFAAESHAMREELARSHAECLEEGRRFERRSMEAEELQLQAEAARKAKSEFIADMNHELRTPLSTIIGFSEVLQDEMFGVLTEKQLEYVGYILQSSRNLLALITDIIDLSKIEADRAELEPERVRPREVVMSAVSLVREKAIAHDIRLAVEVDAATPDEVEADEKKLKQALYILLSSAVRSSFDHGAVTVRAAPLPAREGEPAGEGWLRVAVEDTGPAIRPEDHARLFQPFSRVELPGTGKYMGTGLGLALARMLVELHGGSIGIERGEGGGNRFVFRIPATRRMAERLAAGEGS